MKKTIGIIIAFALIATAFSGELSGILVGVCIGVAMLILDNNKISL